jgi:hypothetical protein
MLLQTPSHLYLILFDTSNASAAAVSHVYIMKNGANLNKDVETHIGNKQTPFGWLHG